MQILFRGSAEFRYQQPGSICTGHPEQRTGDTKNKLLRLSRETIRESGFAFCIFLVYGYRIMQELSESERQ